MLPINIDENTILVKLGKPMEVVATIPHIGDEHGYVHNIVFKFVDKHFHVHDVIEYYRSTLKSLGLEDGIVFVTATSKDDFRFIQLSDIGTSIYMSIGLEPPTCLDTPSVFESLKLSTINIATATGLPLCRSAMVDLLKTLVEAKSIASSDAMLRCRSRSCGTVTDAIAILKPVETPCSILFAGMSTSIGNVIAKVIHREIVLRGMKSLEELFERVTGMSIDELLTEFEKLYSYAPIPAVPAEKALEKAREILYRLLRDPNVWSLMMAARELDLHGYAETIPNLGREEFTADSPRIVADEILGISLALYIAGMNGMFTMYWIERLKEKGSLGHGSLDVFEDDIISALLGALYTLLISQY